MTRARTKLQQACLLLFLLCVAGLVFLVQWASAKDANTYGPLLMAQDGAGRIWIQMNHDFFIFDGGGKVLARASLDHLGIREPVGDICALSNGDMLLGSRKTGTLHFVHADLTRGRIIDPSAVNPARLFGAMAFYCDSAKQEIFVTDTSNHRLLVLGFDGRLLRKAGSEDGTPGEFHFPNGILLDASGRLLVVDTNHHQVQVLNRELENAGSSIPVEEDARYRWPAFIAQDHAGNLYITQLADGMELGQVRKLAPDGTFLNVLPLPRLAQPTALLVLEDEILVADQGSYAVVRLGLDGRQLGRFGDETFNRELKLTRALKTKYELVVGGSQFLLMTILVGILVFYWQQQRQERNRVLPENLRTGPAQPAFVQSVGFVLLYACALLFVYTLMFKSVALLYTVAIPIPMDWSKLAASNVGPLLVTATLSFLACWILTLLCARGVFALTLQKAADSVLRRFGPEVQALLLPQEVLELHAMAADRNYPQLVLLTQMRLLVLTINPVGRSLRRVQAISRNCTTRVDLLPPPRFRMAWLFGLVSTTKLRVASTQAGWLCMLDGSAAHSLQSALNKAHAGEEAANGQGLADVAAPLGVVLRHEQIGLARSVVLTAFMPGLGQLYQQRLLAGTAWLVVIALNIMTFMKPVISAVRKTTEVHPSLLEAAAVITAIFWLVAMLDAYLYARAWNKRDAPGL